MAEDNSLTERLRRWRRRRRQAEQQFREQVRARNVETVSHLAHLSDAELIGTNPGLGNVSHEMELTRRLKEAITELTAETVAARRSADRTARRIVWLTAVLVLLTGALVALTVVLAVRS